MQIYFALFIKNKLQSQKALIFLVFNPKKIIRYSAFFVFEEFPGFSDRWHYAFLQGLQ